jgi:hypothetical protein
LDDGSNPQNSQLAGSDALRWARSSFDRRHNFVISYTYDVPGSSRNGVVDRLTNGWRLGGITTWRSGVPMDITQSPDPALDGYSIGGQGNPDLVGPFVLLDPRVERTFVINGVSRTGHFGFDPTAFARVPIAANVLGRPGTLGRNVVSSPTLNTWGLSIIKRTRLAESHLIELRADIDNLFNHAIFAFPGRTIDFATFGQANSASPGRTIQVSARYSF